MTKFYLAGSWSEKQRCSQVALQIEHELGWGCTAHWLHSVACDDDPRDRIEGARRCISDIRWSERMVLCLSERASLGKHVELGAALERNVPVTLITIGDAVVGRCVFYDLCDGPFSVEGFISREKAR